MLRTAEAAENRASWRPKWANRPAIWKSRGDTSRPSIERGETGAALSKFFAPDVAFEEFPNRSMPLGKKRGLAAALEAAERSKKAMSNQMYKITHEIEEHDRVALEVE